MNLDEVPVYIPPEIEEMSDEDYARVELSRYYDEEILDRVVEGTLRLFKVNDFKIKEFDYIEENITPTFLDGNRTCIRLVWQRRSPLQ